MNKIRTIFFAVFILLCVVVAVVLLWKENTTDKTVQKLKQSVQVAIKSQTSLNPLTIEAMRQKQYPGSDITIEQTLADGSNYHQYLTSYISDGLKIYALLTVPIGDKPQNGWPVILFNHGYIA